MRVRYVYMAASHLTGPHPVYHRGPLVFHPGWGDMVVCCTYATEWVKVRESHAASFARLCRAVSIRGKRAEAEWSAKAGAA